MSIKVTAAPSNPPPVQHPVATTSNNSAPKTQSAPPLKTPASSPNQTAQTAPCPGKPSEAIAVKLGTNVQQTPFTKASKITSQPPLQYKIKPGDTLSEIAAQRGLTVDQIKRANPGTNQDKIYAGDKINLPVSGKTPVYSVAKGDTLSGIAQKYNVTEGSILRANPGTISNPKQWVFPGQELKIPIAQAPVIRPVITQPKPAGNNLPTATNPILNRPGSPPTTNAGGMPKPGAVNNSASKLPVAQSVLPKTIDEANKFFKTQFRSDFNTNGPAGSVNCGPTSVAMSLEAVGVLTATHTNDNIAAVRKAISKDGLTGASDFVKVVPQFGGTAQIINPTGDIKKQLEAAKAKPNDNLTIAKVADQAWKTMDAEIGKGRAVVLQGNISVNYRTNNFNDNAALRGGRNSDTYGSVTYDNYPHILAVVGKTDDGKYLVADPMSRKGTVAMTRNQLTLFLNGNLNQSLGAPTNIVSIANPKP